ncbi:queuosine precursor transporter [Candidatus Roizmanbacteria bacterium]|nr:queuosine precursor transporter [Candidatus Roizmanbacteria bacterium]
MFKIEKLDLIVSLYIFCIVTAELMGAKVFPIVQVGVLKLNASVGILLFPIVYSLNDMISEVYGVERARSMVRAGILMIIALTAFAILAVALPPAARFKHTESAYDLIFGTSIRISLASLVAFALADFLDVYIFSKIRKRMGKSRLWLRINLSNVISLLVDTVVYMTLAFYSLDEPFGANVAFLTSIMIPYWLVKCSMSLLETPFVYAGVKWLRK